MTVTAHIRRTLAGTTPLLVAAGAGDLAVKKLRSRFAGLRSDLRNETWRHDVGRLTHKTGEFARGQLDKAAVAYDGLADRGERLVGRIRRQQTPHELMGQAGATPGRARATRTTPRTGTAPGTKAGRSTVAKAGRSTVAQARRTTGRPQAGGRRVPKKIGD